MIVIRNTACSNKYKLNIGTHNGIFHSDEVLAISILDIANTGKELCIVRTRDKDELTRTTFNVDIGGKEYDHHITGFDKKRATGELYASAGLIWEKFAKDAIKAIQLEENLNYIALTDEELSSIINEIDRKVIIPVDLEDNGQEISTHLFSFINTFLPCWTENPNYNLAFEKAENIAVEIMKKVIKQNIVKVISKKYLENKFYLIKNETFLKFSKEILEIPSQTFPWLEEVCKFNKENHDLVLFVIFPYPAGGWAAQCVPPSIEKKFEKLVPFPHKWAGKMDSELAKISGIYDALFCHNQRFFARAESKESIIEMCNIAMEIYLTK